MDTDEHKEEQIRKQVAYEEKAFNVVMRLLDVESVSEDYLNDAVCDLQVGDYFCRFSDSAANILFQTLFPND